MKIKLNTFTKPFLIKILAVLMVIGMMDSLAFSQTKKIRFARGKTSATIKGKTNQAGQDYVFTAKRGQRVIIRVTSPQDTMLLSVGGTNVGSELNFNMTSDSDYEFTVYNYDQATANYTLYVSIK
jgi:hypothetical protein